MKPDMTKISSKRLHKPSLQRDFLKSVVSYEFAPTFMAGLIECRRKPFHICKNPMKKLKLYANLFQRGSTPWIYGGVDHGHGGRVPDLGDHGRGGVRKGVLVEVILDRVVGGLRQGGSLLLGIARIGGYYPSHFFYYLVILVVVTI